MRNPVFLTIFSIIFVVFGLINYYIGLRGWQTVSGLMPQLNNKVYWVIYWCLAMSYLVARIAKKYLPAVLDQGLTFAGAYWMAAMYYFILLLALVDIVKLSNRWLNFLPSKVMPRTGISTAVGMGVFLFVGAILLYGAWNARTPRVHYYDVTIPKQSVSIKDLHLVMVSDIHLGTIIHNGRLTQLIEMINRQKPDLVLLAGDVIDEDIEYFVQQKMDSYFKGIKSKYGTFAVLGNHEYIGGHAGEAVHQLRQAGITVLIDQFVKVADSFYIVGRDDRSAERFTNKPRPRLTDVMEGMDKTMPVILLDHQPSGLEEGEQAGVDLQFSGHTHLGQLWPNQLITRRIFENDYGYSRKGKMQVIVSSGYGTWGPPIRIGSTPEIVDVTIHFKTGQ